MSYQNVFKPRFFIDYLSYWNSIGLIKNISCNPDANITGNFLGIDPSSRFVVYGNPDANNNMSLFIDFNEDLNVRALETINYLSVLGHNFGKMYEDATSTAFRINMMKHDSGNNQTHFRGAFTQANAEEDRNILNAEHINLGAGLDNYTSIDENLNGCSISKINANFHNDPDVNRFTMMLKQYNADGSVSGSKTFFANSIQLGHFYDMPVSPDLDIEMEIEFDGFDSQTTIGGSTLTNVKYYGNPMWNDLNAWEVGHKSDNYYRRNGRRKWNLKFGFIADEDLFASNYSTTNFLSNTGDNSGYNSADIETSENGDVFANTLADDNSFHSRVLNYIGNGQRFIFQPNSDNNNPDQFAVCVLDQDSISINQVAFKSYEMSLKIKEVW